MKKLILGIAGIVVLDLAFIFALTTGVEDPTELAAVAPSRPILSQPQFPQMPVVESAPVEETYEIVQAKPVRNSIASKGHSTKTPVRRQATPVNETSAPNFKDTIIYYQGPDRTIDRQDISTASVAVKSTSDEPVRRKRNVLSRALSITKKPYDWVKSIASKF
jgi:hypothetical protein